MYYLVNADTIGYAIEDALITLHKNGKINQRENQDMADETKEIQICINVERPTEEPYISRCIITDLEGLAKYDHEFLDGIGDGKGWDYTYHELYSKYYDDVIKELNRNINTRRATIALGQGDINFTANPPCLQLLMFNYVDGKLELTAVFRSNDAVKAFPMNIHAISMLQRKVANQLDLSAGPLHYIANNFHCYSKDYNMLKQYATHFKEKTYEQRFNSYEDLLEFL